MGYPFAAAGIGSARAQDTLGDRLMSEALFAWRSDPFPSPEALASFLSSSRDDAKRSARVTHSERNEDGERLEHPGYYVWSCICCGRPTLAAKGHTGSALCGALRCREGA